MSDKNYDPEEKLIEEMEKVNPALAAQMRINKLHADRLNAISERIDIQKERIDTLEEDLEQARSKILSLQIHTGYQDYD